MDLLIKQNTNQQENGNSTLIDLLYNLTKPDPITGQSAVNAVLIGRITVTAAYEDAVNFLNTRFSVEQDNGSDFQVTVLNNNYYIRFADPSVEEVLRLIMGKDEGEGITVAEASNTFANYFQNNTDIESFDELKHFKTGRYNFNGCTNLESVDITDKYGSFNNCTNLVNWYGGKKPDGYLYIGNPMSSAQSCPGLTELEIGEEAPNLYNQQFSYSKNIEILRCKPVVNYEFGWPAFRGNPVKNIYIENMDNWLTCRTYGSGMIDFNTKIFYNNQLVTSVEIPQTLTQIGANNGGCFAEYRYLTSVQFHSDITSIAGGTFNNCTNLVIPGLNLPNLTSLGSYAFRGTKIQTISDLGNITNIGENCFEDCTQLASVAIPDTVTSIGISAFKQCKSVARIDITDLNKYFKIDFKNYVSSPAYTSQNGAYLYLNGTKVEGTVTLPTGMLSTTAKLAGLKGITEVIIPSDVYTIGANFAYNNKDLASVSISSSVTSIGENAFRGCSSLTNIVLPQICTTIGNNAFRDDNSLTTINLNNITNIGNAVFQNCTNLIHFQGAGSVAGELNLPNVMSIGHETFNNCNGLTSVTIGNSAISIDYSAFFSCKRLTHVTIGNSVTSIGGFVFYNCSSLTSVIINAVTPPKLDNSNAFNNTNNCPIYVPLESVSAYQAAANWSNLASRIQAIQE